METDAEMETRTRSGEPEAFEEPVHRHGQAVHGFLARRGGRQVADEPLTEVWPRAVRGRHGYDVRWSDARPWPYGIARSTLRGYRPLHGLALEEPNDPAIGPWPGVDERLDAVLQHDALRGALATLSDHDRDVPLLVAWTSTSAQPKSRPHSRSPRAPRMVDCAAPGPS